MTSKGRRAIIAIAAVAAIAAGGTAVAGAAGGDEDVTDTPISGAALERASATALEHTGGGRVTETEADDEEGAYEIEVTRSDGSQVDVHLDKDFKVLGSEDDGKDDGADQGDD